MPRRKKLLATNEIYHIFNKSVGCEKLFEHIGQLHRALDLINYYRFPQRLRYSKFKKLSLKQRKVYYDQMVRVQPLVKIYVFALMPNHYHLLLKQIKKKGISVFIANFQNSFAKYFNLKNNRHGTLFINSFKAIRIETDEQFTHLSRYIHLNPVTSFLIEIDRLIDYPWTSLPYYLQKRKDSFIKTKKIIDMFESKDKYWQFVKDQADYQRKLGLIKKLAMEKT